MKKSDEFIEHRIRWRAAQHGVPKSDTYFWEAEREKPTIAFPKTIGKPILVSEATEKDFIILGTRGAVVSNNRAIRSFKYDEIEWTRDLKVKATERKADLSRLIVILKCGEEIEVPTEIGSPAFGIWNILIMLERMS